jgi:hypothetical protein
MNEDDIERKIRRFVAEEVGVSESERVSGVDVVDDLRIYGDDVWDLLSHFARAFNVNMDGLRWLLLEDRARNQMVMAIPDAR